MQVQFLTLSVFCTVTVSLLLKYIKLQKDNKIKLLSLRKSDIGSSAIICSHKSFEIFLLYKLSNILLSSHIFHHLISVLLVSIIYLVSIPIGFLVIPILVWISQSKFWCLQSKAKTSTVYTDLHVAQILTTLSSFKDLSTVTGYAMFSLKISPQITATFNWKNFFPLVVLGLVAAQAFSSGGARASHWGGFSCWGAQAPGARASGVAAHGFSRCCSWALGRRLQYLAHTGLVFPQHVEFFCTRDWTCIPCIGRWILIHCTNREVHF